MSTENPAVVLRHRPPEYDKYTLDAEDTGWRRGPPIAVPQNYYLNDDPFQPLPFCWRATRPSAA